MNDELIKVLLVDDSPVILVLLSRILSAPGTGIKVVGMARDGEEALHMIPKLDPKVICTDLHMKGMNGLELTRNVMARHPRPILVLSAAVEKGRNDDNIFQLLEAGAVDVVPKPQGSINGDLGEIGKDLIRKIKILAGIVAFTRHQRPVETKSSSPAPVPPVISPKPTIDNSIIETALPKSAKIVAIGASTGGPQALQKILAGLSPRCAVPIVCIQHVSEGFTEDLVDWLGTSCPLPVRVTHTDEVLAPGTVYFPPDTKHLIIDSRGKCVSTSVGTVALHHRPSITFAFNSIAQYYGASAIGILLTGMGADGADGLLNIRKAGGMTIAQDEASSVVFGMPKVAAEIGAAQRVLSLSQIVKLLGSW